MIIVGLSGGIGNQMFQYSAGRSLSIAKNCTIKLDISKYSASNETRKYLLHNFNITEDFAGGNEIRAYCTLPKWKIIANKGLNRLKLIGASPYKNNVLSESSFSYDANFDNAPENVYLNGYWQSEKYFLRISDLIRSEFILKITPMGFNKELMTAMNSCTSVSIHIRRGDYITNPVANKTHGTCGIEYYHEAIRYLAQRITSPHFFIFSDDHDWVRNNIVCPYVTTHITHNGSEYDYEDLRLMSQCKYHIIANSSFSWWGAWLSNFKEKIIIAPRKWFKDGSKDTKDLIPGSWIRI